MVPTECGVIRCACGFSVTARTHDAVLAAFVEHLIAQDPNHFAIAVPNHVHFARDHAYGPDIRAAKAIALYPRKLE